MHDDSHTKSVVIWQKLKNNNARLLTTNYILDETYTLIRQRCGLEVLQKFRQLLAVSSDIISVERVLVKDEEMAWKWMVSEWSKLSFTDCISFAVMSRLGLKEVVTFDEHFMRAGFILPRQN